MLQNSTKSGIFQIWPFTFECLVIYFQSFACEYLAKSFLIITDLGEALNVNVNVNVNVNLNLPTNEHSSSHSS